MLVEVNAADLKAAFQDMKPIYKAGCTTPVLGITLEDHILYFTSTAGLVYEYQMVVDQPGPYMLTVLYQDLSELLPTRGVLELHLEPLFVEIKGDRMSAVLQQANSIVSRYTPRKLELHPIQPGGVSAIAQLFAETAPVSKSLRKEVPVIFKPPYAIMKFPTFWLQCNNSILDMTMDLQALKSLSTFAPTQYGANAEVVEFHRKGALLAMPRNPSAECCFVDDVIAKHTTPTGVQSGPYLQKVQQLLRAVGPGQCRCYFYRDGMEVVVSRPTVQASVRVGECSEQVAVFSTFLEYVQMLLKVIGAESFDITRGTDSICLQTPQIKMLLAALQ